MKKSIWSFMLALLLVVSIFPAQIYATDGSNEIEPTTQSACEYCGGDPCTCNGTDVEEDQSTASGSSVGNYVKLAVSTIYGYVTEPNWSNVIVGAYPAFMEISEVLEKDGVTYYRLKAAPNYSWPSSSAHPNDTVYLESTKLVEVTWCADCETYDCGMNHTPPSTEPENSCACCDSCTGTEGCECACGACEFCENQGEFSDAVYTDKETGVVVKVESVVEGLNLEVAETDVTAQLKDFGIPTDKMVFGLDIALSIDSAQYQPESGALVKIPVSAPEGTIIGIIHTHEDDTSFVGLTDVQSDNTIEFYTDGFSAFAGFTVDFYYEGIGFSIEGMSSILLSELFGALNIDEDATLATSVVFTDNDLIEVSQEGDDWRLTSLEAFQTEETLAISFSDGHTVIVYVTDQTGGKEADGSGNTYRYYLLGSGPNWAYSNRGILVWYNNALAPGWGGGTQEITLVMTFPDGTQVRDTGTHFFQNGWSKCDLKFRSNGNYWFEITDWPNVNMKEEGDEYYSYSVAKKTGGDSYIYIQARDTLVKDWDMCTVRLEPKTAKSSAVEDRTVQIYLNGNLYDSKKVAFPARDSSLHSHISFTDETKNGSADIRVTFKNQSSYRYDGIQLDQSNKIYKLYFTSKHTIIWQNWNGTRLETDNEVVYGSTPSYNGAAPTRESTAQYDFSFTGWSPAVSTVTANQTYTAQFSSTTRCYTVTWKNYDGSILEKDENVPYNTTPTYNGAEPVKPANDQFSYKWNGWDKTISPVTGDVTYTATYSESKNTYTVTWKNWDGTTLKTNTVDYGEDVTYFGATPIKNGIGYTYTFVGWDKGSNGTISNVTANTTVMAQFSSSLVTYSIGYDLEGGTVAAANPTAYNVDSTSFMLNNPTKLGYTFDGWTEAISTSNWTTGFINYDTGTHEISSTYPNSVYGEKIYVESGVKYTLSGTDLGGIRWRFFTTDGAYIGSTSDAVFTPNQNGYVHILLYEGCTSANRNIAEIISAQGTSVTVATGSTGNRYYTANWSANNYTVFFNGNGATDGSMSFQSFTYDAEAVPLNANAFKLEYIVSYDADGGTVTSDNANTKATATFNGWATSATGAKVYNDKSSVRNLTTSTDGIYNLYANWTLGTVTLPTPSKRENYSFGGWYSDATLNTWVGDAGDTFTPTGNVTLYAKWIQTNRTVTVVYDDSQLNVEGLSGYTEVAQNKWQKEVPDGTVINLNFTPKTGYKIIDVTIGGISNGTDISGKIPNYPITTDVTFSIISTTIVYNIIYDLAGGVLPADVTNPGSYTVETDTFSLNNPAKPGYRFKGWGTSEDDENATETVTIQKGSTGNKTFYAVWERVLLDLTITAVCDDAEQNFGFSVSGTRADGVAFDPIDVVLCSDNDFEVTIKDLPEGTYTVTEKNKWSWREKAVESKTAELKTTSQTVSFDFEHVDEPYWLNGYSYKCMRGGN